MTLQEILESVKSGSVSVEEAERILKKESYEEMGYAKLDTSRKARTGFAEVIYCSNKADEHLLNIFERLYREDGEVFGTRASQHQYELVKEKFPEVEYDPISRILKIEKKNNQLIQIVIRITIQAAKSTLRNIKNNALFSVIWNNFHSAKHSYIPQTHLPNLHQLYVPIIKKVSFLKP